MELETWKLHDAVAAVMEISDWGFEGGNLYFRGRLRVSSGEAFARVRGFAAGRALTARLTGDEAGARFILVPERARPGSGGGLVQLGLLLLTLLSTLLAGAMMQGVSVSDIRSDPFLLARGAVFALPLLAILGIHESAHYLAARRWGLRATLPYFIPFPNILGTMGAMIAIRDHFPSRRALLDVGAAGPLAGFVVSILVILLGLGEVRLVPFDAAAAAGEGGVLYFGDSLLTSLIFSLKTGPAPGGYEISLGPLAFAGWVGLFVTALNLLPLGQLDGGHIAYAVFGQRYARLSAIGGLLLLAAGILLRSPVWVFILLMVTFMGARHPPPLDDLTPLNGPRLALGALALIVFILCFIPVPIRVL